MGCGLAVATGLLLIYQNVVRDDCPRVVSQDREPAEIARCYLRDPERVAKTSQSQSTRLADDRKWLDRLQNLEINDARIPEASYDVTRLLTVEMEKRKPRPLRLPQPWLQHREAASEPVKYAMQKWERRAQASALIHYIIWLYGENYKSVQPVINPLLERSEISTPDLLIVYFARKIKSLSIPEVYRPRPLTDEVKKKIQSLFTDSEMITWINSKSEDEINQLSGYTNTILGVYDWISYKEYAGETGFSEFPTSSEQFYDLGGGFATPDISRLLRHAFTSFDRLSPHQLGRSLDLNFKVLVDWSARYFGILETRPLTQSERESYFKLLQQTPWVNFDVFKDHFPTQFQSYFITSFGFMSSTVRSDSEHAPYQKFKGVEAYDFTFYMAVRRVIELVALGKDVDLFAYQRASERSYRYRTVFLSFRKHRLVKSRLWPKLWQGNLDELANKNADRGAGGIFIKRREDSLIR